MEEPEFLIVDRYRQMINAKYPDLITGWPVVSGFNTKRAGFKGWVVFAFEHTGISGIISSSGAGELPASIVGVQELGPQNLDTARANISRHFGLGPRDALIFSRPDGHIDGSELDKLLAKHELAMGFAPDRVFLSHKGVDKARVREFARTLELLGFKPWLDEDAMQAGVTLHRGILAAFKDSCAACFFVTPNYVDEKFLADEVNYAIDEKHKKGDRFAIITLVLLDDPSQKAVVPDLLKPYVWKSPKNDLEALREILRALPMSVGPPSFR